jgi:hypothetical protein
MCGDKWALYGRSALFDVCRKCCPSSRNFVRSNREQFRLGVDRMAPLPAPANDLYDFPDWTVAGIGDCCLTSWAYSG